MIVDAVKVALLVFAAAVLQIAAVPQLSVGGGGADLVLIVVVMLALLRGMEAAALAGFAGGLLLDATLFRDLGVSSLLYLGAGCALADRYGPREGVPAHGPRRQFLLVLLGAAAVQAGQAVMQVLLGEGYPIRFEVVQVILPTVIQTGIAAAIVLPVLRRLFPPRSRFDVPAVATA